MQKNTFIDVRLGSKYLVYLISKVSLSDESKKLSVGQQMMIKIDGLDDENFVGQQIFSLFSVWDF